MSPSSRLYYNAGMWTIPKKQARSTTMVKVNVGDANIFHPIQPKPYMLHPLLNMFDRWASACFNKRQVAFMNHISPRFFRNTDVKPIDQMNTLIKLNRFFILHLVLSPLVFFIPLYHVLGRKHFT